MDTEQVKGSARSQVLQKFWNQRMLPGTFCYAYEISDLSGGIYVSLLVEILKMVVFHELGSFVKAQGLCSYCSDLFCFYGKCVERGRATKL